MRLIVIDFDSDDGYVYISATFSGRGEDVVTSGTRLVAPLVYSTAWGWLGLQINMVGWATVMMTPTHWKAKKIFL
jgi:hypothetical protein